MKEGLLYSLTFHTGVLLILFVIPYKSSTIPKQYYIDFIGSTHVSTPQNFSEIKSNIQTVKNEELKEQNINESKTQLKTKEVKTVKQIEDPDYLYTNTKTIMQPSMAEAESDILRETKISNNIEENTSNTLQTNSSSLKTDSEFPYPWYIIKLRTKLWEKWQTRNITTKNLKAIVRFRILKNGNITGIRIENSSGNHLFDQSVISTVSEIERFDPLPEDFNEDFLTVYVEFKATD